MDVSCSGHGNGQTTQRVVQQESAATHMPKPNLFHFATSELSQDAFICWLASCADASVDDKELRDAGTRFLSALLATQNLSLPNTPSIRVYRQLDRIDVAVEINESIIVLIEDKVGTADHSGQLKRYLEAARVRFPIHDVVPIYIQTYIQPGYEGVRAAGFSVLTRRDLMDLLPLNASDSVLSQFREHLEILEQDYESYRFGRVWSFRAWERYLEVITTSLDQCGWSYVPNASGGFLAAYWGWTESRFGELYLQVSQERLSVRISPSAGTTQADINAVYSKAREFSEWTVVNARRPRKGRTQNLVCLEEDHRRFDQEGNILLEETVRWLRVTTKKLKSFAKSMMHDQVLASTSTPHTFNVLLATPQITATTPDRSKASH